MNKTKEELRYFESILGGCANASMYDEYRELLGVLLDEL
jgi:hypothetical protein